MGKPIGIVELYQHNEVLIHFCDLLLSGNQPLIVFCNSSVYDDLPERIKKSDINWVLNDSEKDTGKFIKKNEALMKKCRFLLITTVHSHFRSFIDLASHTKTALIIHSAHTWLQPFRHIHLRKGHKTADSLRLLKFIFFRQAALRRELLQKVHYIALPNDSILHYVKSNFKAPGNAKFVVIPFTAYLGLDLKKPNKDHITLTITGTIGEDVRDYRSVLEAMNLILPFLNRKLKLILLGKPKKKIGHQLKEAFDKIEHEYLEIITFGGYIPQVDFDNYLIETDYLILPLKKYTQFYVFRELTCFSKLSGSVNDMIRYGIPAMASKYCHVDEAVDKSILYYKNSRELADLILGIVANEKALRSKDEEFIIYSNHTRDRLYSDLMHLIDG